MKKILISLVFMALSLAGNAQSVTSWGEERPVYGFKPHAYISLMGGAAWDVGEGKMSELLSPAAQLAIGVQMNKYVGLRLVGSGWEARGKYAYPEAKYCWNIFQGAMDVELNLSSIFAGWNPDRLFDFYAFGGGGLAYSFRNGQAVNANRIMGVKMQKLWTDKLTSVMFRGGLGARLRFNDVLALTLEVNSDILPDDFNSKMGKNNNKDCRFSGLLGLTVNLGKTRKTVATMGPKWKVAETPVVKQQPVVEQPIIKEQPVVVEQPIIKEEPVVIEQPVVVEQPVIKEEVPVVEEKPVVVEKPVVEKPVVVEEPAVYSETHISTEDELMGRVSKTEPKEEQPVVTEETPVVVEEPAVKEMVVEEPVIAPANDVAIDKVYYNENIYFANEENVILSSEIPKMERLRNYLDRNPQAFLRLSGYSVRGMDDISKDSEVFIRVVTRYLESSGIDSSRILRFEDGEYIEPFTLPRNNRVCVCYVYDPNVLR